MGWSLLQNGALIAEAEAAHFEVLVSGDKNLEHQQNLDGRLIALVCLSAINWPVIRPYVGIIVQAVDEAKPGTYKAIQCGHLARKS